MAYNGSGTFSPYTPGNPVVTGTTISSSVHNATVADLAAGLTNAVTRDGQSPATANIPMGNNKLTGLAAATVNGDAVRYEQIGSTALSQGVAEAGANSSITSLTAVTSITGLTAINGGAIGGILNVITNGGFTVNQRGYVSGAALASGSFGHDRWKAGASGGDYSFTQLASDTTITIAASKSLIQVVAPKDVQDTSYVLSWTGTAQARYAVNSATPSGAYAASPILITGQTPGTVMSVEFNTGTLGKVQLERGAVATSFERRPYAQEMVLCLQHCFPLVGGYAGFANGSSIAEFAVTFPIPMYASPALAATTQKHTVSWTGNSATNPDTVSLTPRTASIYGVSFLVNQFDTGASPALASGQGLTGVSTSTPYGYYTTGY